MIFQTTIERRKAQNTLLYIWLIGAIISFVLWHLFLSKYYADPVAYSLKPGDLFNDLQRIEKKYSTPLVAIYSPWLSVMVASLLFGDSTVKAQQIKKDSVAFAIVLSLILQMMIAFTAYLFLKQPDISVLPFEPLPAFIISLIGTVVTFAFPEQKGATETYNGPQPNPNEASS